MPDKTCDHSYRVLDAEVTTTCADCCDVFEKYIEVTFYCEKCLDIKYVEKSVKIEE